MPERPDLAASAGPRDYAQRLTAAVARCCGDRLRAAYLHGSAALGGWIAERSDVDVLYVAEDDIGAEVVAKAGHLLLDAGAGCPGRGLEASMVAAGQAAAPAEPWPFLVHVGSGPRERRLHSGSGRPGDPDLLMHYAVCRQAAITLLGPPPQQVIGPVPRPLILSYLAGELDWGLANATENYAVLNACRALEYLLSGRIVSKIAGGESALERGDGPAALVRHALDQQRALAPERPPGPEAIAFVRSVAGRLAAPGR
jgi:hypothetical protein